jgi:hypothetical protein
MFEVAGDMRPLGGAQSHRRKFLTGNGLLAVNARIQLSLFPHRKDSFLFWWEQITPTEANCPLAAMVQNWRQSRFVGRHTLKSAAVYWTVRVFRNWMIAAFFFLKQAVNLLNQSQQSFGILLVRSLST